MAPAALSRAISSQTASSGQDARAETPSNLRLFATRHWHSICPFLGQKPAQSAEGHMIDTLALGVIALAVSVNVAAAASVTGADKKDFQLLKEIATSVDRYTQFTIFDDVSAQVKDGYVTLSGKVTMPYKRDDIERRVSKINGVAGVRDEITVLPVSTFDDDLRFKIARSIYGHSNFWNYAIMPNPPIHIVVEHGRGLNAGCSIEVHSIF